MKHTRLFGRIEQRMLQVKNNKMSMKSPVRKNMVASLFGVGINLLNQIVLVPFYIIYWGNELYSDWIVISSLTAIFSMSDVGLNNVIQNRFSIKYSEGNIKECNSLLSCNFFIVTVTFALFLLLALVYLFFVDITESMGIRVLNQRDAGLVFVLLLAKVFISMYSGIQNAIYRATHHADRAIYFDQITFFIVVILTFVFVITKVNVVLLCITICLPYIVLVAIKYFDSRKYFNHQISLLHFNWPLVREMIIPSATFMSFPLGNSIILQGFTLVVNKFFGADEVVLYNTSRTMCNFIKTLLGTIQSSVWPEYSIAYGQKNFNRMRSLHKKSLHVSVFFSIIIGLFIILFGPFIYDLWLHGEVSFNYPLMTGFVIALIIESAWISSSVTVMATNNHTRLGLSYMIISSVCLVGAIFILHLVRILSMVTIPLIMIQLVMVAIAFHESMRLTQDKISNLFKLK